MPREGVKHGFGERDEGAQGTRKRGGKGEGLEWLEDGWGRFVKGNEDRGIRECLKKLAECLQRMGDGCIMVEKSGIGFKETWR